MKRSILLQTSRLSAFAAFVKELERLGCAITPVDSAASCQSHVREQAPDLVVIDAASQEPARQLVLDIMRVNALVYTAVVTDMEADVFHDTMEGLGILTSLPLQPTAEDAQHLKQLLDGMQA